MCIIVEKMVSFSVLFSYPVASWITYLGLSPHKISAFYLLRNIVDIGSFL